MAIRNLALESLQVDPFVQTRVKMSDTTIKQYMVDMQTCELPPIVVFEIQKGKKTVFVIADGHQRFEAAKALKLDKLKCNVHKGTLIDAFLFASTANRTHGLPMTQADMRNTVQRFFTSKELAKWSDTKIAAHVKCSQQYVSRMRSKVAPETVGGERDVERGGKTMTMKTDKIGKSKGKKGSKPASSPSTPEEPSKPNGKQKPPAATVVRDGAGKNVPVELQNVFRHRQAFVDFQEACGDLINAAKELFELPHDAGKKCNVEGIVKLISDARAMSRQGMPYVACKECKGTSCKACGGRGWVTETEAKK